MAPFEWLTPERVMRSIGILAGVGMLGAGAFNLYLALVFPDDFVLFGVDVLLVGGGLQILAGVFFLINEYWFRPPVPSGKSE